MYRSHTQTTCPHGLGARLCKHVQVSYPDHLSSWPGYEVMQTCTGLIPRPLVLMAWVRGYANMYRSHTQTTCPHGLGTRLCKHVQVSYPDHLSSWPGYEVIGDSSTFSLTTGEAGGSRSCTPFMKSCIEVSFSARKLSRGWS